MLNAKETSLKERVRYMHSRRRRFATVCVRRARWGHAIWCSTCQLGKRRTDLIITMSEEIKRRLILRIEATSWILPHARICLILHLRGRAWMRQKHICGKANGAGETAIMTASALAQVPLNVFATRFQQHSVTNSSGKQDKKSQSTRIQGESR
jgi:hypothetical protein